MFINIIFAILLFVPFVVLYRISQPLPPIRRNNRNKTATHRI